MKAHYLLLLSAGLAMSGCVTMITPPEMMGGLEKIELWKVRSELVAESAPADTRSQYETARRLANSWIDRKKADAQSLGTVTWGRLDLSESTLSSSLEPSVDEFLKKAGRGETKDAGAGAALVVWKVVQQLIKEGREANAAAISGQLEQLRWRSWEEIRNG